MRIGEFSFLIFYSLFFSYDALNCRSNGGPKDGELKKVYNLCMKKQGDNNESNHRGDINEDFRGTRGNNQWSQNNMGRNRGDANKNSRMEETVINGDHGDEGNRMKNRDWTGNQNKMRDQNSRDNSMEYRKRDENDGLYLKEERQNRNGNNRYEKSDGISGRNDFFQREDFGYNNQYSTQPTRRYKRERRMEMNTGKRSQYNPNPQRFSGYEERYEEEKNSRENSTKDDESKACALHCLLESLGMTGEDGMPDRYLVTHIITKDVKDEDLKDFLQESIEECFQILDNENSDNKCEFSKNFLTCLSEKGKENCDDWKDDFQF